MCNVTTEKHKAYAVKFKLKAVDVVKKKSIAAASREFGVKHSSSDRIIFNEHTSMKNVLAFLSGVLTQLLQ